MFHNEKIIANVNLQILAPSYVNKTRLIENNKMETKK